MCGLDFIHFVSSITEIIISNENILTSNRDTITCMVDMNE